MRCRVRTAGYRDNLLTTGTMAKKIDFTALPVKDIEGNEMSVNIAKALGNQLYMQGQNVDECELGKKIYYSEGEMELHDEEVRIVLRATAGYPFISRSVIEKKLR